MNSSDSLDSPDDTDTGSDPEGSNLALGIGAAVILGAIGYCGWLGSSKPLLGAVFRRGAAPDWAYEDAPADNATLKAFLLQGIQLVGNARGHMAFAHALRQLSPAEQSRALTVFVYPKLQQPEDRAWWARFPDVMQDPDYADLVHTARFCWPDPAETEPRRFRQVVDSYWPDFTASVRALMEM